jgi:hypothetical protein
MAHVRFSNPLGFFFLALAFVLGFSMSRTSAVHADGQEYVRLADGSTVRLAEGSIVHLAAGTAVNLATPAFLQQGKRYAFTWAGGGPAQTYAVKAVRPDGWVLVEVADEVTRPDLYIPGEFPTRWLNVGLAVSIQEMRPLP